MAAVFVNFAPQKPKIGRIGKRAGHAHPYVNITVDIRRRKCHARDVPFVEYRSACGYPSVPFTDGLVYTFISEL